MVRAGQTTFNFSSQFQHYIFNRQRLSADGILIPNLHKALPVSGNTFDIMYNLDDIIKFISEKTGDDEITETTDIEKDLGCNGDDFHELIEEYSKKFNVDLNSYLWYFHTGEEGNSIGGIFFEAPNHRVKRIAVTPSLLLDFANKGKWNLEYPAHKIPKKRPDLLINALVIVLFVAVLLYYYFIR